MVSRADQDCDYVYKGTFSIFIFQLFSVEKWVLANQIYSKGNCNVLRSRYHKGIFTRIAPTIGVEFLTKKIVL